MHIDCLSILVSLGTVPLRLSLVLSSVINGSNSVTCNPNILMCIQRSNKHWIMHTVVNLRPVMEFVFNSELY